MTGPGAPTSAILLYQVEDGRTRIECRLEDETLWLTQAQIADLFQTAVANINIHLQAIYAENGLTAEATIKSHLTVRSERDRQVSRPVLHYSLPVIIAVGFRVQSHHGTQFREWATERLGEYLVNGRKRAFRASRAAAGRQLIARWPVHVDEQALLRRQMRARRRYLQSESRLLLSVRR